MFVVAFALVVAPTLFAMVIWVVVTVCRICFPEKPLPFQKCTSTDDVQLAFVGSYEIYRAQRRLRTHMNVGYIFETGESCGIPPLWYDELWNRRN